MYEDFYKDGYVIMGIRHLEAADMKGENDG
jgi:hypothetical protein